MGSTEEVKRIVSQFDVPDTPYLKGLTAAMAVQALSFCADGKAKVTKEDARLMVERLLDFYSHQNFRSADAATTFAAAVTALVTEVSYNAARRAFHPVTGLPRKEEFLSVARVAKALEAEEARYYRIMANAHWVIAQKEAAERQAAEDKAIEEGKGSAEQRAEAVARLLSNIKTAHAA